MHIKKCSDCEAVMSFKTYSGYIRSVKNDTKCKSCCVMKHNFKPRHVPTEQICKKCNIKFKRIRSCKFCSDTCRMRFNTGVDLLATTVNSKKVFINGRQGHYNGVLFRSSYELRYILEYLEKNTCSWKSAEYIRIPFTHNGVTKMYKPDFIIDDSRVIEIKPIYSQTHSLTIIKKTAAEEYCKNNNMSYEIVDMGGYSLEEMLDMHTKGTIQLNSSYVKKYFSN